LEVVEFDHLGPTGEAAQPENVRVADEPWRTSAALDAPNRDALIAAQLVAGPDLLGNRADRVPTIVAARGMEASLAIIEPSDLAFELEQVTWRTGRRARAHFSLGSQPYALSVTDNVVEPRLLEKDFGFYSFAELGLPVPPRILLTVSLAGAFGDAHFKLVAGVIPFSHDS
jgi:hypothetical protein